ncbi:MAG: alpha/beta fold hydrolase [Acidimicrobiales bacterium]|nr:alpha/beta fold hydrolase [Acidimicrobiales bacterium]
MSELSIETTGDGDRVLLVHGSLATAADEWSALQPLADEGCLLVMPDRRGYGTSPSTDGEDFVADADDLAWLLDGGSHVVAHSYGGLGAILAAARRPDAIWSLTLLEPPAFTLTSDPAAQELVDGLRAVWDLDVPDHEWLLRFVEGVGTDPDELPPEIREQLVPLVPLVRRSRPPWDRDLPFEELAAAPFPTLVVSGGHHDGFEAVCDELARRTGGSAPVIQGAGHEIQFTGQPLNDTLLDLWRSARTPTENRSATSPPAGRSVTEPSPCHRPPAADQPSRTAAKTRPTRVALLATIPKNIFISISEVTRWISPTTRASDACHPGLDGIDPRPEPLLDTIDPRLDTDEVAPGGDIAPTGRWQQIHHDRGPLPGPVHSSSHLSTWWRWNSVTDMIAPPHKRRKGRLPRHRGEPPSHSRRLAPRP